MKASYLFLAIVIFCSGMALAESFSLPKGKGKCPHFTFDGEKGWKLKSDRKAGERWVLLDSMGKQMARFEYKLSATDQKQLPEVESKEITLGAYQVQKYTVTTSFPEEGVKATEGLITSYSYEKGRLNGLTVMSIEYDAASELDKKIERVLATIK